MMHLVIQKMSWWDPYCHFHFFYLRQFLALQEGLFKMSKNHSVVVTKPGVVAVEEVPAPKLRDDYILVKVKAVALNPTDWKHVDFLTSKGARVSRIQVKP
jgi:hypothetical protein